MSNQNLAGGDAQSSEPLVPDYPTLQPNVELVGEMQDSAFQDRQWLIQRNGQYIQVSELLYRVAESASGAYTVDEVAEHVTRSTEWLVSADNVRQVIQMKLIPLGIIAPADEAYSPDYLSRNRTPSPLTLNMRMKVIGPSIIDPVTRVLQALYWPPIAIAALLLIAAGHWWLYVDHGLEQAIANVIYTPGVMVLLLPMLLLAGVFHEFGHASALRYGGGRARGMGAGIYLIYPAFYTDATDSYRLSKWGKLRTDLGGFYFHLIFALGLIAAYLTTGLEFLLIGVLLVNLDMVRQLIPFIRLDGYWILTDLTGVPDLFTQIKPLAKSLSPFRDRSNQHSGTSLKRSAKIAIAGYALVTIPLLALVLVMFLMRAPVIFPMLWDSLRLQGEQFNLARNQNDYASMTLSMFQQLLLVFQFVAIGYLLFYVLGRRVFRFVVWGLTHPAPMARIGSALGTIALVLVLAYIWIP